MSKSYSKIELLIAGLLNRFPKSKAKLKLLYQRINSRIYAKDYNLKTSFNFNKLELNSESESFFGYYDKSPINSTGEFIIFHSSNSSTSLFPDRDKPVDIVLLDIRKDTKKIVFKSKSYNWQQGCRLQWINPYEFIFNTYNEENSIYQSIIYNAKELKVKKVLDLPIYDCYLDSFGMTLNFSYLGNLAKDYGYFNLHQGSIDYDSEGLWYLDLKNFTSKLIISFTNIISFGDNAYPKGSNHTINHIMISPDGKKVIFIHRWYVDKRRFDRLILCNCDGTNLRIISSDGVVSHCYWLDAQNIIGYFNKKKNGLTYYKFNISTFQFEKLGPGIIDIYGDGHPSFLDNKILFDTYPDKSSMQTLFLFDLVDYRLEKIAELKHPIKFNGPSRCDLHPRFGNNSNTFFVDSVYQDKRNLYMITK